MTRRRGVLLKSAVQALDSSEGRIYRTDGSQRSQKSDQLPFLLRRESESESMTRDGVPLGAVWLEAGRRVVVPKRRRSNQSSNVTHAPSCGNIPRYQIPLSEGTW